MFTSATKNTTVASIFDIQYRSWFPYSSKYFDDRQPYPKGRLLHVDHLLAHNGLTLVEGVIADMRSGGIGYRNHSAPLGLTYGAEWEEDILWVEPDISCVNSNLSLQLTLDDLSPISSIADSWSPIRAMEIVDGGGFAHLQHGDPTMGWPAIDDTRPNVQVRASRTAWLNNFLTAMILNITDTQEVQYGLNVSVGAHYGLKRDPYDSQRNGMVVHTDGLQGKWLNIPSIILNSNGSLFFNGTFFDKPWEKFPYLYGAGMFEQLRYRCSGSYNGTTVQCAQLFGTPLRIDGGPSLLQDPGSKWSVPLHICAGAVKASAKTVSFFMNGSTASLDSLVARDIKEKQYKSTATYPLWAAEDETYPGSEGASPARLWGIVNNTLGGVPGYNFTRAPSFYLPYSWSPSGWDIRAGPRDILAGSAVPYARLIQVFGDIFDGTDENIPRYSGHGNIALRNKWRSLTEMPGGSELLLRLVWTDLMASTTVGTVLTEEAEVSSAVDPDMRRKVTVYSRRITYDLRYAIPAILFLATWLLLLLAGLIMALVDRHSPKHLKQLLNQTSLGRVATLGRSNRKSTDSMWASTEEWLDAEGNVRVRLGAVPTTVGDSETQPDEKGHDAAVSSQPVLQSPILHGQNA